jgi:hypothetical protein
MKYKSKYICVGRVGAEIILSFRNRVIADKKKKKSKEECRRPLGDPDLNAWKP